MEIIACVQKNSPEEIMYIGLVGKLQLCASEVKENKCLLENN